MSRATGVYENLSSSNKSAVIRQSITIWLATIALLSFISFLLKNTSDFSRGTLTVFTVMGVLTIIVNRLSGPAIVRLLNVKGQLFATKVLLIKTFAASDQRKDPAFLADVTDEAHSGLFLTHQIELDLDNLSVLQTRLPMISKLIAEREIDEVHFHVARNHIDRILEIFSVARIFPVPVRLIVDPILSEVFRRPIKQFGNLLVIEMQRAPLSLAERASKRVLDVIVASLALFIFAPLFVMVALLVKLESPGPIFFVQQRKGFVGKSFKILKFRSMKVTEDGPHIKQATSHDPRVTRVGKFIRRTSIDELPQLLNVLLGDMSIVGPRPHATAHDDHYGKLITEYAMRHHVKPGLTGLSQVIGLRGETPRVEDMKARVETDISYINNWSFWSDLVIITKTAFVVLGQRKAY